MFKTRAFSFLKIDFITFDLRMRKKYIAYNCLKPGRGYTVQTILRDVSQIWVAKLAFWYINAPCLIQNLDHINESIFKRFPKFEPKLAQIKDDFQNRVILVKIWSKIEPIGI